jgi:hypothetical protein
MVFSVIRRIQYPKEFDLAVGIMMGLLLVDPPSTSKQIMIIPGSPGRTTPLHALKAAHQVPR